MNHSDEIVLAYCCFAQILSQCNIYEAGSNKIAFEYYTEKVSRTIFSAL